VTRPKIAVFFGTRPEAIKMAPLVLSLATDPDFDLVSVSTGQHREMLQQVIEIFDMPVQHDLRVMSQGQTLASLSALLMTRIDELLELEKPDFALVQGDTTTVLMASLACFYRRIPTGHIEAGLRTGDLRSPFPEEANRVLATTLSTLHFAPTITSEKNLLKEHVPSERIFVTGNTVIDALQWEVSRQKDPAIAGELDSHLGELLPPDWRSRRMVLITGHRRENFGDGFDAICAAIEDLAKTFTEVLFVYPVHLNPNVQAPVKASLGKLSNVHLLPPQSYRPFVALMRACMLVLTDSGGVQEEAPALGKPVLVMRNTTERPEGVDAGTVKLVGPVRENIVGGVSELLTDDGVYQAMAKAKNPYGDGRASDRIRDAIASYLGLASDADGLERRTI
jgi:UDP-N-acetylglucosamine 2-epimerase (non-hydrolysing)